MPIRLTRSVKVLSLIILVGFILQKTLDLYFGAQLGFFLSLRSFSFFHRHFFWQVLTYPFVSSDVSQLCFNLLMFVFVGSDLEQIWGARSFLKFFFFCTLSVGLIYVLSGLGGEIPLSGLSGVLYGLFAAYGILLGERTLLFMMIVPIQAKYFALILAGIQLLTALFTPGAWVTGLAHLTGMGMGFLYLWMQMRWRLWSRNRERSLGDQWKKFTKKRVRSSKHLKLVVNRLEDMDPGDEDSKDSPKTWH